MSNHDQWKSQSTTVFATDETWQILSADVKAAVKAKTSLGQMKPVTPEPRSWIKWKTFCRNVFCRKRIEVMFLIWLNQNNQGPVQLSTSQRPAKALKSDSSEADFHFTIHRMRCTCVIWCRTVDSYGQRSLVTSHFRTWLRYRLDWTSWQVITSGHYLWHSPSVRMFTPVSMFTTCCTFMSRKKAKCSVAIFSKSP